MLYHLFDYIDQQYNIPGTGVFQYITFRAFMAVITSLLISMVFGGKLIAMLRRRQVGESIRDLGLKGQNEKAGTPTMGGLIIIAALVIPTLLFAKLNNVYVQAMLLASLWLGIIGFADDYIKVFKKNKQGLAGKFKVIGQVGVGLMVGSMLYFDDTVVIRHKVPVQSVAAQSEGNADVVPAVKFEWQETRATKTTIPFVKNNEFDYAWVLGFLGEEASRKWAWLVFIPFVIFLVTAVSNGANMTDGLDGLATGTSAIIGVTLGILAFLSGNYVFADYLNIMYIPESGEMTIFIGAFVGACIGFLWYNAYPAQVFMGDTGSLALGGIIAVFAIAIRKELLIPIFCGVFLIENLSVMIQVGYFKYTKRRLGEGKRVFLMAPIHHHFQKKGWHESKIVARFWIIGIMLAVITLVTLKLR
ncbi:MAG: phospho-N-acetylmuramoyl-pentapeptide-transferase [Cryomorphaceae bacterium]|nr:MAG: phospho-N-acetylmuramoyl-pentapeptide-transferase [Cryomorphaceae bacterium]